MTAAVASMADDALDAALARLDSPQSCCGGNRELLALLREDAALYRGRGAVETERLRAFIMVRIAQAGLADDVLPYVLEELETGNNAYGVAAAAIAARSATAPRDEMARLLAGAIERIRPVDEFVDFGTYPARPDAGGKTAVAEAIETLAMAGPEGRAVIEALRSGTSTGHRLSPSAMSALEQAHARAKPVHDCCCHSGAGAEMAPQQPIQSAAPLWDVELQNQDGVRGTFGHFFGGRTGLIAFFYTRCMNPDKCSRTISKLAQLRNLIDRRRPESSAIVAGISYDPEYDLPARLHRYGTERGLRFGALCQLLRTTGSFEPIRATLQLGVGYGPTTVNRHRLELVLIDPAGTIVDFKVRRLWDEAPVADAIDAVEARFAKSAGR